MSLRDQIDMIELLTWNDYGESDYIGPIKGDQPDSQAWTDGMNHTGTSYFHKLSIYLFFGLTGKLAWLGLTQYYATAFKTGRYPAIEKDQIVVWSRPHSTSAKAPDPVPQPTNFQLVCHFFLSPSGFYLMPCFIIIIIV
jgi:glucan endo-1,3-alpha-glucosidase